MRPAAARIAPFAVFIAFLALQPLLERFAFVDPRWIVVLRGFAAAAVLACFWRSYSELREPSRATPAEWLLAVVLGFAVFGAWIVFASGWAVVGEGGGKGFVPLRADGSIDPLLAASRLLGLALVVPVMEELFWRSFLMRWIDRRDFLSLDPRMASGVAIAVSSALFATEHSQWFAGLLAGAAYGFTYKRSGNLWLPIVSHGITNGTLAVWILATGSWSFW